MRTIEVSQGKTLKLQNLLSVEIDLNADTSLKFDVEIQKMNTFIKTHGQIKLAH